MKITRHDMAVAKLQPIDTRGQARNLNEGPIDAEWRMTLAREAASAAGSQRKLADMLGVPPLRVTRWVGGVTSMPEEMFEPLAEIVGFNLECVSVKE